MRVLVTGATGQLGPYVVEELIRSGHEVIAWSGQTKLLGAFGISVVPVPLESPVEVQRAWAAMAGSVQVVLHLAAVARVEDCAKDPVRAEAVNVGGTQLLCELAASRTVPVIYVSTDFVFDGGKGWYTEDDEPHPLSLYGQLKWRAERTVLQYAGNAVLRLSLLFGPGKGGRKTFSDRLVEALRFRQPFLLFQDEWRTPLAVTDAALALRMAVQRPITGLFHVGGPERLSRYEMGVRMARALELDDRTLRPAYRNDVPGLEPRPADVSLCSRRWKEAMPGWTAQPLESHCLRWWGS